MSDMPGGPLPYEFKCVMDYTIELPRNARRRVADAAFKDFARMAQVGPLAVQDPGFMQLFREWFVFDWPFYRHNHTVLQDYLQKPPPGAQEDLLEVLRQAEASNTVGEFLVEGAFPAEGVVVLRDVASGLGYAVHDGAWAAELGNEQPVAMVGARLVNLGGNWMLPTGPVYAVPGKLTPEQKEALVGQSRETDFLDLVHTAYRNK